MSLPDSFIDEWVDAPGDSNAFFVYEAYRGEAAFAVHQSHDPNRHWKSGIKTECLKEV